MLVHFPPLMLNPRDYLHRLNTLFHCTDFLHQRMIFNSNPFGGKVPCGYIVDLTDMEFGDISHC